MNYPNGIKTKNIPKNSDHINYANRGMSLEDDLNITNQYYRERDIAFIYKKPTPIKITKVFYPSRREAIIKEAFFEQPSTTDYNGLYKGNYIDFEAKETQLTTSFPLSNIHPHQIEHIKKIVIHGGICFLIVRFVKRNETYLLTGKDFIDFIQTNNRKSIPLPYFKEKAYLIKDGYLPRVDYLKIVDKLYGGVL